LEHYERLVSYYHDIKCSYNLLKSNAYSSFVLAIWVRSFDFSQWLTYGYNYRVIHHFLPKLSILFYLRKVFFSFFLRFFLDQNKIKKFINYFYLSTILLLKRVARVKILVFNIENEISRFCKIVKCRLMRSGRIDW